MKFDTILTRIVRQELECDSSRVVPALIGEPGIGKSEFVSSLARQMDTKAFTIACNQLADKSDLTGARLVKDADGGFRQAFYPHEVIVDAIAYATAHPDETPILFLDEINRTTPDVTSGVLTLVTARRIGHDSLPDNLRIIVAGNDKGNVGNLDEASVSRFVLHHVEPDASTLVQILGTKANEAVRAVLEEHPECVFERSTPQGVVAPGDDDSTSIDTLWDGAEQMLQLTTPRTIEGLSDWLNHMGRRELKILADTKSTIVTDRDISLLEEVIESHVGNTKFASYVTAHIVTSLKSPMAATRATRIVTPEPAVWSRMLDCASEAELSGIVEDTPSDELAKCVNHALNTPDGAPYDEVNAAVRIAECAGEALSERGVDIKWLFNDGHQDVMTTYTNIVSNGVNATVYNAFAKTGSYAASLAAIVSPAGTGE